MNKSILDGLSKFSREDLAEIYNNLNRWEWDMRLGEQPEDWMDIDKGSKFFIALMYKFEAMEEALKECDEQNGLLEFLDKNEWAITEDYISKVARKALEQ